MLKPLNCGGTLITVIPSSGATGTAASADPMIHRYDTSADSNGAGPPFTRTLVVKVRESPVLSRWRLNETVPVPACVASTWIVRGYSLSGERTRVVGGTSFVPEERTPTKRAPDALTSRDTFWPPFKKTCHVTIEP